MRITMITCTLFELPTGMDNDNPEGRRCVFLFISVSFTSTADWYIVLQPCLFNERIDALMHQCMKA